MIHTRVTPLRGAAAAHETLTRGATFLAALAERPVITDGWPEGRQARVRARFLANCLRELDRFLHGLLDELGASAGHVVREDQRNTANKLRAYGVPAAGVFATGGALVSADEARLRALGRSSACLIHCNGWVRRPDVAGGDTMTVGWRETSGPALARYALGTRLAPGAAEIIDVCGFYDRLGDRLLLTSPLAA
ncbi:hypothetical protein FHT00_002283 [Sphingomonas insulae]|uniref:Uncharacterized protein n=1 Tax=Sphingomonas insulae TaxID=424800 RepID=A0ABN1HL16_9SPHN|nr:hypothetical protein [Sphingomonas insulae]NIJ30320.1 hypothetical protein [Sphingomonas insulae]